MKSYFTIEELCKSDTAKKQNIDNNPSEEVIERLKELIAFLNPIREAWGSAIIVTSGYRCPALNKAVGGSETSVHQIGYGVDLVPKNGKTEEFKLFLEQYVKDNNLKWDQILFEKSKGSIWVHLGLYNNYMQQRMIISHIIK